MMLVVICSPGEVPESREIAGDLASLQACVGGNLQLVPRCGVELDGFDVYCNEDGIGLELPFNCFLGDHMILGPIAVSKSDEMGHPASLTAKDAARAVAAITEASLLPLKPSSE
jgi:hypothetical protein